MKFAASLLLATVFADDKGYETTFHFENEDMTSTTSVLNDPETGSKISEMRQKFSDYFSYSFNAKGLSMDEATQAQCSTSQECDTTGELTQCCVSAQLTHTDTDTKDVMYRCMTKTVANAGLDLVLDNFQVKLECIGSGAAVLGASVASLVALTLY